MGFRTWIACGVSVGDGDGLAVGDPEGAGVGDPEGSGVGEPEGAGVCGAVGTSVCAWDPTAHSGNSSVAARTITRMRERSNIELIAPHRTGQGDGAPRARQRLLFFFFFFFFLGSSSSQTTPGDSIDILMFAPPCPPIRLSHFAFSGMTIVVGTPSSIAGVFD